MLSWTAAPRSRLRCGFRYGAAFAAAAMLPVLAACTTGGQGPSSALPAVALAAPPVAVSATQLPGNWGLASYHNAADRDRTISQARVACGNPYQIGQGQNGGVLMHLADQSQPSEVFVKTDTAGRSFIGPRGAPGMPQDRVFLSFENGVMITEWIDPGARERFGTMVFVRCA